MVDEDVGTSARELKYPTELHRYADELPEPAKSFTKKKVELFLAF